MKFRRLREKMVSTQIEARGIHDQKVLGAMRKVPRHLFVGEALQDQAYGDFPLPIGEGQTISQPFIVAEMTQTLELTRDDRVLEIGMGSGYQTAILAELAYQVYTIERIRKLFIGARKILDQLKYYNVVAKCSDGTVGWPDEAPFDAIIITAGAPEIPEVLIEQLETGGRLVIPVGGRHSQTLTKIVKGEDSVRKTNLGGCRFVKLIGSHGWEED
ncbi:MAG: protein-L-isoaspartate(D-aspartate) O-methyltransferase [Deltaproteobacteria bacterium]|nr:protein-L-isoaspartate(D-aspartate) O-methyltransferase [Deltaproteobacteria bacterium]MBW2266354.1 protein-L-isoaspartate(D-aspartate) O-methyltransferase [Deltaproteobacteria bacterium]MBW2317844.1 protein-L-isoaspartate(D-aspartate) O-methyltransferase [Deltaproteobacteria bacterium]MBW2600585.1 protein-L-isoaspartate(D-aspartate) O-methyltransferase [Deltaproteobacteria bacterium]